MKSSSSKINFTQINLNKSKAATGDLALYLVGQDKPIVLAQEPHVNGKNVITRLAPDIKTIACSSKSSRPRACIYYHKSMTDKLWIMDSLNNADCAAARTVIDGVNTIIATCYMDGTEQLCPPQAFRDLVQHAKTHNLALIVGSDVNAHNTAWNSSINDRARSARGDSLLEYLLENNLMIENEGSTPTFDNGRWTNVIDLTITNQSGHRMVSDWNVIDTVDVPNASDHNYITFISSKKVDLSRPNFRSISNTNWETFEAKLEDSMTQSAATFSNIDSVEKLDVAAEQLSQSLMDAFNSATDLTYISSKVKPLPWQTAEVLDARKDMRAKLRLAQSKKQKDSNAKAESRQIYEKIRNRTISVKFKDFCQKLEAKSDSKRISSLIKPNKATQLGTIRKPDGSLSETPLETLNVLADVHFGQSDANPPDNTPQPELTTSTEELSWDLDHIFSENRVKRALTEFNPLTAAGPDGIRPIMLQKGWNSIKTAVSEMMKASFNLGYTPDSWRNSTGIFLPKPGKADYHNPKSFRTITLAPVPLKWMERVILWHMEVDLKIYDRLSKKQYGFRRGCSTIAAVHKLVRKIEFAILNQGMALGTFLDIEGAFDNVSFDAISKALDSKCESKGVNRWIMSMIHSRRITVELHGEKKVIVIKKGCPQGGILSPFLWNLVVNELLEYTRDKIPSDLQGFADDMSLCSIVTARKQPNGKQGYDADTLREVTQKSLNAINDWCKLSGLKLSHLKSHCVMFTKRRSWSFSRPLKVDGSVIDVVSTTKFLGLTLDSKLSWNDHITNLCKKSKNILMQCRRAVGPTWGFKPTTMRWIYNVMVKPIISYGATIWINGTKTKHNQDLLNGVQRLANVLITGAMPSTPGTALNVITGHPPIALWLEEEAAKGTIRLKNLGHWQHPPAGKLNMRFSSHIPTNEKLLKPIPESAEPQDHMITTLSIDQKFTVDVPNRDTYNELDSTEDVITCFTDGSQIENQVGAAIVVQGSHGNGSLDHTEAFHLGTNSTVFQAEVYAVGKTASFLLDNHVVDRTILINCDSQAAIRAINSTLIKSKSTLEATVALNTLAESNKVTLRWIPAHSGYEGNELADQYAKKGSTNDNATSVRLPIPRCVCYAALRRKTLEKWISSYKFNSPSHFSMMWRDKFAKELAKMGKRDLRLATQILTGHSWLNSHLSKLVSNIQPLCPRCDAENETVSHLLGQCPLHWQLRVQYFDAHHASAKDIVDRYSLNHIINYVIKTGRLAEIT